MLKQRLDDLQDRTRGDIDSIHGEIGTLFPPKRGFMELFLIFQ